MRGISPRLKRFRTCSTRLRERGVFNLGHTEQLKVEDSHSSTCHKRHNS